MTRVIQILLLAVYTPLVAVAQQAAATNSGDLSEVYTMRGEYKITPQPDGKTYILQRLARDGSSIEDIVLTKTSGKNRPAEYIDQSGSKYTPQPDGSLREVRVKQTPSPPPQPVRTQPANPNPAPVADPNTARPALTAAAPHSPLYNGPIMNSAGVSELRTMRGEYKITPQPDGKTYMLQRLAHDGTSIENIVLTRTSGNSPAGEYIDQSGTRYTQLPDGSLREVRVKQAPSPPNPNPAPVSDPLPAPPASSPAIPNAAPYNGPLSGTLTCDGARIPQNGERVFNDLPPLDLNLIYDQKTWDAKLENVGGHSKRLILTNKKPGEQKKCEVHWQVVHR